MPGGYIYGATPFYGIQEVKLHIQFSNLWQIYGMSWFYLFGDFVGFGSQKKRAKNDPKAAADAASVAESVWGPFLAHLGACCLWPPSIGKRTGAILKTLIFF